MHQVGISAWNSFCLFIKIIVSAVATTDYTEAVMTLTFLQGSMNGAMECLDVTIANDTALEGDETFAVTLTTSDTDVMLGNNQTEVTISDEDG